MEVIINLLTTEKSKAKIGVGIFFILIIILWMGYSLTKAFNNRVLDWLLFINFMTLGISYLIEGMGISFLGLFGAKAFIRINDEQIHIKHDIFLKGKSVKWSEIKSIEYKSAQYKITKTDNRLLILKIPTNNYKKVQRIKEAIKSFAFEKGIQIK